MTTITEGNNAPAFTLPCNGDKELSLSDFKGKRVILYFYPKDNTPGCTIESKDFRDLDAEFGKYNCQILGISKDSVKSHDRFVEKYDLPFPLLSDESGEVCEKYGVWIQKSMFGKKYMGIERTTVLIDEKGIILKVWNKVSVKNHACNVLNFLQSL